MASNNVRFTPLTDAEARPAKIVSDPGMAIVRDTDSKVIPIVQIDATDRPDIVSLIAAHGPGVVGEAATQWGRRVGAPEGTVTLFLDYQRPLRVLIFMDLHIVHYGFLVDEILRAGELYIQAIQTPSAANAASGPSRMRVVVADTGFGLLWDRLLEDELARELRKQGLSATKAKTSTAEIIRGWRSKAKEHAG
jgi:hypothetical protein